MEDYMSRAFLMVFLPKLKKMIAWRQRLCSKHVSRFESNSDKITLVQCESEMEDLFGFKICQLRRSKQANGSFPEQTYSTLFTLYAINDEEFFTTIFLLQVVADGKILSKHVLTTRNCCSHQFYLCKHMYRVTSNQHLLAKSVSL